MRAGPGAAGTFQVTHTIAASLSDSESAGEPLRGDGALHAMAEPVGPSYGKAWRKEGVKERLRALRALLWATAFTVRAAGAQCPRNAHTLLWAPLRESLWAPLRESVHGKRARITSRTARPSP
jgi:hypothetical protein